MKLLKDTLFVLLVIILAVVAEVFIRYAVDNYGPWGTPIAVLYVLGTTGILYLLKPKP